MFQIGDRRVLIADPQSAALLSHRNYRVSFAAIPHYNDGAMSTKSMDLGSAGGKSLVDRILGLAGEVRAGEGLTALILSIDGFLVLAAYYVIRPLRSAFLLPVRFNFGGVELTGAQIQSYAGAILAALF